MRRGRGELPELSNQLLLFTITATRSPTGSAEADCSRFRARKWPTCSVGILPKVTAAKWLTERTEIHRSTLRSTHNRLKSKGQSKAVLRWIQANCSATRARKPSDKRAEPTECDPLKESGASCADRVWAFTLKVGFAITWGV
jgi:hypothetical protein